MTKRQRQTLDYIKECQLLGFTPSLKEIGEHMGIGTTNGVRGHLMALQRQGVIYWDKDCAKTLRVIGWTPASEIRNLHERLSKLEAVIYGDD